MKEAINIQAMGKVSIFKHTPQNELVKIFEGKNAIQIDASEIIARNLLLQPLAKIDNIEVYDLTVLKATGVISLYSTVANHEAKFSAVFNGPSFSGDFNRFKLRASGINLTFAEIAGMAETKTNVETITIEWTIAIL